MNNNNNRIERWVTVKDFPNYKVSSHGRVINQNNNLLNIQFCGKKKQPAVILYNDKKAKTCYISRLVALHFIKNNENFTVVKYIDGNKQNNHFSNLDWVKNKKI